MSQRYNSNPGPNSLTNQYRLINTTIVETPLLGLLERAVYPIPGFSLEVYRDHRYVCSLRVGDNGMGQDVLKSVQEARLRNGDVIYHVNLNPQKIRIAGSLNTKDRFKPGYSAEVTLRINNPLAFLESYFQNSDPLAQMRDGIEEAFQRYARETEHDRIKEKDFEYTANKNRQGRRTGLWIVHTHATINWDPQRQQLLAIERQSEIEQKRVEMQSRVQSQQNMYSRQERSLDTEFTFQESARKQSFQRGEHLNDRLASEMEEYVISTFVMEIQQMRRTPDQILQAHPEIADFINTNPEVKRLINARLQQRTIQGPSSNNPN